MASYDLIIKAVDQTRGVLKNIERQMAGLEAQASRLNSALGNVGTTGTSAGNGLMAMGRGAAGVAAALYGAWQAAQAFIQVNRDFQNVSNQLRLVTNGSDDLANTMSRLRSLADENRTSFASTAELYTKLKISTESLGYSSSQVEALVTKMSQALALAGADANTASGVIRQFGQAMSSGTVRGDEFNSIVEGLGPALQIMARESGLTVGELRNMSQAGQLTSQRFAEMLLNSNALTDSFQRMAPTIEQSETRVSDAFARMSIAIGQTVGAADHYQKILTNLATSMNLFSVNLEANNSSLTNVSERLKVAQERLAYLNKEVGLSSTLFGLLGDAFRKPEIKALNKEIADLTALQKQLTNSQVDFTRETNRANFAVNEQTRRQNEATRAVKDLLAANDRIIQQNIGADFASATSEIGRYRKEIADIARAQGALATAQKAGTVTAYDMTRAQQGLSEAMKIAQFNLAKAQDAESKRIAQETAEAYRQLGNDLDDLSKQYQNSLPALDQYLNRKTEIATRIDALNTALTTNKNLTAEQRTTIENAVAALQLETTALEKRARIGDIVYNTEKKVTEALSQNRSEHLQLTQAVAGLESGTLNANYTDEQRLALLLALRNELKENEDAYKKLTTAVDEYAVTSSSKILEDGAKKYRQMTLQTRENEAALADLNSRYRSGTVTLSEYRDMVKAFGLDSVELKDDYVSMALTLEDSFKRAGDGLASSLAEGLAKGKLSLSSFSDFFNQILDDILTAIIQKNITQPLIDQLVGGGSNGSGLLGSLLGSLGGGSTGGLGDFFGNVWSGITSFFGGFFADGGNLGAGKWGIAGESGPEIIRGPANIQPVNSLNTGSAAESPAPLTVNFNINAIDTRTGTEFLLQNKPQIIGMVTQAYNKQGRRGVIA